jgi:hypothetical protein
MIRAPADAKDRNVKFDLILRRADVGLNDDENQSDKIGNDFRQICVKLLKALVHMGNLFVAPATRMCRFRVNLVALDRSFDSHLALPGRLTSGITCLSPTPHQPTERSEFAGGRPST